MESLLMRISPLTRAVAWRETDDEFSVQLDVAFKGTVEAEVAGGGDVTFDKGAVVDDVDGAVFSFHCSCHFIKV